MGYTYLDTLKCVRNNKYVIRQQMSVSEGFMPLVFDALNGHSTIIMQFRHSGVCVKHFNT